MKFLKSVVDKSQQSLSVRSLLEARVGGTEPSRDFSTLHASMLSSTEMEFCPREVRLYDVTKKKMAPRMLSVSLRTTFDEGNDKQSRVNNDYLKDRMHGYWRCESCGAGSSFGLAPHGDTCSYDESKINCLWKYVEPRAVHKATGFSGSIDALVDVGKTLLRLIECKIIVKDDFKTLKAPLAEHKLRTNLYLRLIEESEQHWRTKVDTSEGTVLYICRGYGALDSNKVMSPFREFVVTRDDSLTDGIMDKAMSVRTSREQNKMPAGVCAHALTARAKKCGVCKECFSGVY